jgi:hypothetical protein
VRKYGCWVLWRMNWTNRFDWPGDPAGSVYCFHCDLPPYNLNRFKFYPRNRYTPRLWGIGSRPLRNPEQGGELSVNLDLHRRVWAFWVDDDFLHYFPNRLMSSCPAVLV